MKILSTFIVFVAIASSAFAFVSLFRFVYVHIKAFFIRRKLSNMTDEDTKDD